MIQPSGSQRRLVALSEEEVERLRDVAHDLADGFDQGVDTDPKYAATLRSLAARYEDGITEEEALGLEPGRYRALHGKLRAAFTHPDNSGGSP